VVHPADAELLVDAVAGVVADAVAPVDVVGVAVQAA
jgi:hypothetical protein